MHFPLPGESGGYVLTIQVTCSCSTSDLTPHQKLHDIIVPYSEKTFLFPVTEDILLTILH